MRIYTVVQKVEHEIPMRPRPSWTHVSPSKCFQSKHGRVVNLLCRLPSILLRTPSSTFLLTGRTVFSTPAPAKVERARSLQSVFPLGLQKHRSRNSIISLWTSIKGRRSTNNHRPLTALNRKRQDNKRVWIGHQVISYLHCIGVLKIIHPSLEFPTDTPSS